MKEQYQPAELEVINLPVGDIIQTSSEGTWGTRPTDCTNDSPTADSWV